MRIVFMGSPDFAIPSLLKLHESTHELAAVVSGPDKRRGRGRKTSPTPVKAKAQELHLPVIEVEDLKSESFARQLRELKPDVLVVVAFRILPQHVLDIPSKGSVNLHASLLPKYRGAAPIHRAVINGESETGCTVFLLDQKVDTGGIINSKAAPIGPNETTGDVYERLKNMGGDLLLQSINAIADNSFSTRPQDDAKATAAPKIFTDDCKVDFHQPARNVHNKIRGLSPFPTAWATLDKLKFNMYRSRLSEQKNYKPGTLHMREGNLLVGCAKGSVILEKVQLEGKRKMSGQDFMHGYDGPGLLS